MANPVAAPSDSAAGASPAAAVNLTIHVDNLRSAKGMLSMCLTDIEDDYTKCADHPQSVQREVEVAVSHSITIEELAPGTYYLMVLHDENANGKMDKFLGIPREGFGFSGNPGLRAGPPRSKHVRFTVGEGATEQRVKLRYLL